MTRKEFRMLETSDQKKASVGSITGRIKAVLAGLVILIVACSSDKADVGSVSEAVTSEVQQTATDVKNVTQEAVAEVAETAKEGVKEGSIFDAATVYARSCTFCHQAGVSMAPKTHDTVAWETRKAKGMAVLIASVKSGLGAMPPRGMCNDCSDENYEALIEFMASPKT